MPSLAHEILVDLFKNRPSLGVELLTEALGVTPPPYTASQLVSIDLTQIHPTEYRADVVTLLLDGGVPSGVQIVEVQLGIDAAKRYSWPEYATGSRARYRCPVSLLVVAPDPAVAAWCAEPIETGIPGFVLRPPVLGRAAIPVVTDPAEAARRPELAVLSAMAHGDGEQAVNVAAAALPAVAGLEPDRARFYGDLVLNSLNQVARRALEAMMIKGYEFQSDFAKKYVALGRAEGRAEGRDEGRAEGRDEGRAEGEARALLAALRVRGIPVPEAARERILAEKDPERLERWVERAIVATSLDDVLTDPS